MKKNQDREAKILNSARMLFWKYGFRRVSVDEICLEAGVSKMTFYRYFENKTALARAVFDIVVEEGYLKFRSVMEEDLPVREKIRRILLMKFEGTVDISAEFLNDFYTEKEPDLRKYVMERTREAWTVIIEDLKRARDAGLFRKDLNLEFFFLMSGKFTSAFEDEEIKALFSSPAEMIQEFARLMMYGIVPET